MIGTMHHVDFTAFLTIAPATRPDTNEILDARLIHALARFEQ